MYLTGRNDDEGSEGLRINEWIQLRWLKVAYPNITSEMSVKGECVEVYGMLRGGGLIEGVVEETANVGCNESRGGSGCENEERMR